MFVILVLACSVPATRFSEPPDADGDGATACFLLQEDGTVVQTCVAPDCDDTRADVYPGAPRRCAYGIDHDCNGVDDERERGLDCDRDGDPGEFERAYCGPDADLDSRVRLGMAECCDGVDNDCDGEVDEQCGRDDACRGPE